VTAPASPPPEGLLVVDKPAGWTSHDVVARARRLAGTRRVGHAGTLDPMATGVLVLGLGRATRLLGHLALTDKEYDATVRLGVTTSTDDADGDVVATQPADRVATEDVLTALATLTGPILQVPSAVSAVQVGGVRAYAAARAGSPLELAPRPVVVSALRLVARRGDELDLAVACSTGTYVRALARDLGAALGVGASLTALRRTRVGPFRVAAARPLPEPGQALPVVPLSAAVAAAFPRRDLAPAEVTDVRHGRPLSPSGLAGPVGAFDPESGVALALLSDRDGLARPLVVLSPAAAGRPAAPGRTIGG